MLFSSVAGADDKGMEQDGLDGSSWSTRPFKGWTSRTVGPFLLTLGLVLGLGLYISFLPTRDSALYRVIGFSHGARVQIRSDKFVRVDRDTRHLVLTESIPWLQGSTFHVFKRQEDDECFQLRSSYGTWLSVEEGEGGSGAELNAKATSQGAAAMFSAIDPSQEPYLSASLRLPNVPNTDLSGRRLSSSSSSPHSSSSAGRGPTNVKLKLCAQSQWLGVRQSTSSVASASASAGSKTPTSSAITVGNTAPTPTNWELLLQSWRSTQATSPAPSSSSEGKEKEASEEANEEEEGLFEPSVFEVIELPQWRGVNLGGWFIPEVWMNPAFFNDTGLGWGGSVCSITWQNHSVAEERMRNVIENFVTEKDFEEIASMGFNAVRLPVGYWNIIKDPYKRYSPGDEKFSLYHIDWAFSAAEKFGLKVLLDLHGAPGSQNGQDHSGCGMEPEWLQPRNIALSLETVEAMAARYGSHPALLGFEVLNEPSLRISQNNHSALLQYYTDSYRIIRQHSATTLVLFNELYDIFYDSWNDALVEPSFYNVVLDIHLYDWQSPFTKEPVSQHVLDAVHWRGVVEELNVHHPLVVGEWCMSSGTWHQAGQPFVNAAVKSFDRAAGWFMWNWKIQRAIGFDEWDVQYQHQIKGLDPLQVYTHYDSPYVDPNRR